MAVMTISIDDDIEARFRKVAKRVIGEKKGYPGQAVTGEPFICPKPLRRPVSYSKREFPI